VFCCVLGRKESVLDEMSIEKKEMELFLSRGVWPVKSILHTIIQLNHRTALY